MQQSLSYASIIDVFCNPGATAKDLRHKCTFEAE